MKQEEDAEATAARTRLYEATGRRIKAVREARGVSQAGCARGAGIDTSSLFRIETGKQNVTLDTLARLSVALDAPMSELLVGVEPEAAILVRRLRNA